MIARTLSISLVALVMSVVAPGASASTGDAIAARCVHTVGHVSQATVDGVHRDRVRAVRTIRMLAAQGASDAELVEAAREGRRAVTATAQGGRDRIARVVGTCVTKLEHLDADRSVIARVRTAGAAGNADIHRAADRARDAIDRALAAALGG